MKDTYPSKVIEAWIPQLPHHLANTKICVFIFDNGLKHLDSIILVGKETMLRILSDGAGHRHQPLASPVLWRWQVFRRFLSRSEKRLFRRAVVLPISFPLSRYLTTTLRANEDSSTLVFSSSFLRAAAALTLYLAASISTKAKDEYAQVTTKKKTSTKMIGN